MSQMTIFRKELLKSAIADRTITSVDVREIRFQPGQQTGRHLHPCDVFGYVAEGSATYKIEGQPEESLPTGAAFHEPANTVIADFKNASDSEPMTFIAFYLLEDEQDLIRML